MTFADAWEHVRNVSAMTNLRAERLWWYAEAVREIPGDIIEIGVYRGASLYLLAMAFQGTGKTIHGVDTFTGFPDLGPGETGYVGEMAVDREKVEALVDGLPVKLWQGRIGEGVEMLPLGSWALVHIDCDLESCYRAALPTIWPAIIPGGVLVMDDYGFGRWPGAARAAHEFFDGTEYRIEGMRGDDWSPEIARGTEWAFVQGVVRKCR